MLIAARAVQGAGAAVLAPTTLTLLTTTYKEGPRRTRASAIWTAMALGGGTAGNLIGGTLTQLVSWRSILLINVPIGTVAVVAALAVLAPDPRRRRSERVNFTGAAFATLGLAALVTIAGHHQGPVVLAATYGRAFVAIAVILAVVAALASILPARRDASVASGEGSS